jgi:DNA transformation protein
MKQLKGTRLFVNLSATQVRRRLKGHGFGVRKIASDGRNRAVIVHTATGEHRRSLEALFQDVFEPTSEPLPEHQPEPKEDAT